MTKSMCLRVYERLERRLTDVEGGGDEGLEEDLRDQMDLCWSLLRGGDRAYLNGRTPPGAYWCEARPYPAAD